MAATKPKRRLSLSPPPDDPIRAYAEAVRDGSVPACKLHRLACVRHLTDLDRQRTPGFPYYFDIGAAQDIATFFTYLRHVEGEWAGRPIVLEPWQRFVLGNVFGWRHTETGLRRFRTTYEELPRKNAKSTKLAGVALRLAFFDQEPGAQVYCAATKRQQAKIVFDHCKRMVQLSPQLSKHIGVLTNNLHNLHHGQKLEPLGADADTTDGLNISAGAIDELHAHKTRAMVDVLETATAARRQPLLYYITTAGNDPQSVCWELHEYSAKILEGILADETWFAFITGIDPGDDWRRRETWQKANPMLGISVKERDLAAQAQKALEAPGAQAAFKQKHLNVWLEASNKAIEHEQWKKCAGPATWLDMREQLKGRRRCLVGLDLAATTDLAAAVLVFDSPDPGDESIDVMPFFWIPEEAIARRAKRDRVPYMGWVEQGMITATRGAVIDYQKIRFDLNALDDEYTIEEIDYDPWNATQLATELGDGDGFSMVKIRQGRQTLNEPTKRFLSLVGGGQLRHGGHPVLAWMASNAVTSQDSAGNLMFDKAKSIEKIDGIAAIVNGLARLIVLPRAKQSRRVGARIWTPDGFIDATPGGDAAP